MPQVPSRSTLPSDFFVGTWAARITLPVTHPDRASSVGNDVRLIDDVVEIRGRIERGPGVDGGYSDSFTPSLIRLPKYKVTSPGREATLHQLALMKNVFDQGFFPSSPPYNLMSNARDSFGFTSDAVVISAGVLLDDPVHGAWPRGRGRGIDIDYDGNPGVALVPALGNGLTPHPAATRLWRLTALHLAFRLRFTLSIEAKGTDVMKGDAHCIGSDIDAHIFNVETSNSEGLSHHESDLLGRCTMAADFRLSYAPERLGTVSMVRTRDVSNAAIREMQFS